MDLDRVLKLPKHHRRTFLGLLTLIVVLLVILDFWLTNFGPNQNSKAEIFSSYIRSVVAAVIVALFTFFLIQYFLPEDTEEHGLSHLSPANITEAFETQLENASTWQYRGNFGRYLRGKVLPTLAGKTGMRISACIIDPKNSKLCEEHSQYRSQINGIDKGREYTIKVVQKEVLTTILMCAWYSKSKGLSIDLFLTSVFDPVRTDASDKSMIVTVEDRRKSALLIQRSHFMYDHFGVQISYVQRQGEKISMSEMPFRKKMNEITKNDIEAFFVSIGMEEICSQIGAEQIRESYMNSGNPYEN